MNARLGGFLGVAIAVLAFVAIGRGGAADATATSLMIADVQSTGEVLVKRNGETTPVAAYVGLQLFPKDTLTSTAKAEVTLFDEAAGTSTLVIAPDAPVVVGGTPPKPKGVVAGLKASLTDLFGSAEEARNRDREVGAVQADMMIARMPDSSGLQSQESAPDEEPDHRPATGKDMARKPASEGPRSPAAPPATRAYSGNLNVPPLPAPAASPMAPGGGGGGSSKAESAQREPEGAPEVATAPVVQSVPEKQSAPADEEPTGASKKLQQKLDQRPGELTERFRQANEPAADADMDDGPTHELESGVPSALLARLEELDGSSPLARARRVTSTGTVPSLAAAPAKGRAFFTSAGASINTLEQTLGDGSACVIRVVPDGGAEWSLQMKIAPAKDWEAARAVAKALLASDLPNPKLLAANLLESRGFVLMAYKLRLKALNDLTKAKRSDSLMRTVYAGVGQHALQLGDWETVARMQRLAPPKK